MTNSEAEGKRDSNPEQTGAKIEKLQEQMNFVINFVGDLAEQVTELRAEVREVKYSGLLR